MQTVAFNEHFHSLIYVSFVYFFAFFVGQGTPWAFESCPFPVGKFDKQRNKFVQQHSRHPNEIKEILNHCLLCAPFATCQRKEHVN